MDLRENLVASAYNSTLGNLGAGMEAQGFQNQLSLIQGDASIEGAYASLGASGVRANASAADAVERQAAVSDQAMGYTLRSQERQNESALIGAYASLAENKAAIGENRYAADWMRKSFEAGGENYEKYEFAKKQINETWKAKKEMYQTAYDNADYTGWDAAVDLLSGGNSGFMAGVDIASYVDKYGSGTTPASSSTSNTKSTVSQAQISYTNPAQPTYMLQSEYQPAYQPWQYNFSNIFN
jgi:hypothetical protein